MMTLYRSNAEIVEAFRYLPDLETMDFKYPYPDWLEGHVVVRGEFGLELNTKSGKVTVRPGAVDFECWQRQHTGIESRGV
jgi:hypothetical protein